MAPRGYATLASGAVIGRRQYDAEMLSTPDKVSSRYSLRGYKESSFFGGPSPVVLFQTNMVIQSEGVAGASIPRTRVTEQA